MLLSEAKEILKNSGYRIDEDKVSAKRFNTAIKNECAKLLKKMEAEDNNLFDDFTIVFNDNFTEMTLKCVTCEKGGGYTSAKKLGKATISYISGTQQVGTVHFWCKPSWRTTNQSAWLCATQAYDPELRRVIEKWFEDLGKVIVKVSAKFGSVIPPGDITVKEDITIEEGW